MTDTAMTVQIDDPLLWGGFIVFIIVMLLLDLFVFGGKKAHKVTTKEAALWSAAWVLLALGFNSLLWWYLHNNGYAEIADQKSLEFLTGYIIEKSLSVDNVFVFLMIFTAFHVPDEYQRRVLIYGVIGAIVMRAIMIFAGAWVVEQYSWVLYLFGAFLVITGFRMLVMVDVKPDIEKNPVLILARKVLRVTDGYRQEKFLVRENGLWFVTPLFLVLLMIELTDLVFAVDSIPAIFAITTDPFIVFTSNIFAILGLRALYFLLADMANRFHLLKYGLAMVLTFVGCKLLLTPWYHMPMEVSLSVIVIVLGSSILASLWVSRATRQGPG